MKNELMQKAYKIGDFARKMGVSTYFLKYYEEEGILHPVVKENGYRFYSLYDSSVILECKRLKNMGFSVREVRELLEGSSDELARRLAVRERALAGEIAQQQLLLNASHNLRAALRLCEAGEWRIGPAPEAWFLPHTQGREFIADPGIYDQLEQWMALMPAVYSARMIGHTPDGGWSNRWGLAIDAEDAAQAGLQPRPPVSCWKPGRVFERYFAFPTKKDGYIALAGECLAQIRRMNLAAGDTLFQQVFCYLTVDGERRQYSALRVPVWEQ